MVDMKKFLKRFCQIIAGLIALCALYMIGIMIFVAVTDFAAFSNRYTILFGVWLIGGAVGFVKMGKGIKLQDDKTFKRGAIWGIVLPLALLVVYLLAM